MSIISPYYSVCERVNGDLLGEPLNLMASVVFFIAAGLLWRDYRRSHAAFEGERLSLIGLLALMGAGSTAFHAEANRLTLYADTAAVSLFISFACYITLRLLLGLTVNQSRLGLIGLGAAVVLTNAIPAPYRLNESVGYLPVLGGLAFAAWRVRPRGDARTGGMWMAVGLLAAGVALRSADYAVCPSLPIGTFFLWRLCESLSFYCLVGMIWKRREQLASPEQCE